MRTKKIAGNILPTTAMLTLFGAAASGQNARDLVKGNLVQFNDNGAYCRYQDERALST
jgi:hypothetical protein